MLATNNLNHSGNEEDEDDDGECPIYDCYKRWEMYEDEEFEENEEDYEEECVECEDIEEDEDGTSSNDESSTSDESDEDESVSNDGDFENFLDQSANEPLYEGAPITVVESVISILTLMLTFRITGVLLVKILEIIELHCKKPNKCFKTLYKFKSFFKNLKLPLIRHFYCNNCFSYLKKKSSKCKKCKEKTDVKYFIEIPIIAQLRALFRRPGFYDKISTHRFNRKKVCKENLEDIYDGSVYKNEMSNGFLSNKSNISFTWNTDGVPLFKSSKFSIWPLYLVINELPYEERIKKENIIIVGIWFGTKKPNANLFLSVFRNPLKKLYKGVFFKTSSDKRVKCRAKIICGTCDLPAKSLFLNMKQYNGYYGCQKCYIRGLRIQNTLTYPYQENLKLRTSAETINFAKESVTTNQDVYGVKGPTLLSSVVVDFINTTAVDTMHCIYLNVIKRLMSIWFESEHSDHPASIRGFMADINKFLCSICPLEWLSRKPRNLEDSSYWKASELKAFLLYYSLPILKMFLPEIYFKHHALLVDAVRILNSSSISTDMLIKAEKLLKEYVKRFEILYGKIHMTANIHLLLHLADTVRAFGPCFTTSCFPFEDLNGTLKSFVHGSKNPELQIYSSTSMLLSLTKLKDLVLEKNSPAANYCKKTEERTKNRKKLTKVDDSSYMIGIYYKEKEKNVNTIINILPELNLNSKLHFIKRLYLNKIVYETQAYCVGKKTNSSCIKYSCENEERYGLIKYFVRICNCTCTGKNNCSGCDFNICKIYAIIAVCKSDVAFYNDLNGYIDGMNVYKKSDLEHLVTLELKNIICTCFQIDIDKKTYFVDPINSKEVQ